MTTISKEESALLSQIQADPTDLATQLVYADWLEERGDSRSEFVRALVAQASEPSNRKHQTRLRQLRPQFDPLWLAAVGDTARRLRNIARVLDAREGEDLFESLKSLSGLDPQLRCPDSCLVVRSGGTLLDLEVCSHATDPNWSGNLEEDLRSSPERIRSVAEFIAGPEIAPSVRSLYLWTTAAANGTAAIDLDGYVAGGEFSNLKQFGTNFSNEDGECILVSEKSGNGYEEAGLIARLLAKCPVIEELTLPSAPNHEFFSVGERPLAKLRVKAGFATQDFILNLSRSNSFPRLETLVYEESDTIEAGTPFDHFAALLRSPALENVQRVEICCPSLQKAELNRLRRIRKHGVTFRQT